MLITAPTSRTAIVTGANKGIGLAIVRNLALQYPSSIFSDNGKIPLLIYLTARDQGRGEAAVQTLQEDAQLTKAKALAKDGGLSTIRFRGLDISKDESIKEIGRFLSEEHPEGVDIVVNNAGIAMQGFDADVVKQTLGCNYHGTLLATQTFLPLIRPGGRLVNVASMAGHLSSYPPELQSAFLNSGTVSDVTKLMDNFTNAVEAGSHKNDGWPSAAYSVSKCGEIGMTRVIAKEEAGRSRNILVNSCCPGFVSTDMTKGRGAKTVDQGAATPVMLALGDLKGTTGEFWQHERVIQW